MSVFARWLGGVTLLMAGVLSAAPAGAFEPFEVTDIRLEGIQRIAPGTVFNYLPVQVGDTINEARVAESIRALYDTGLFQDVTIKRDEDILVVELVERPSIARIEINGNDEIADENLLQGLRDTGLAEGRTFNRSLLTNIERTLEQQYFSLGLYDVSVESTVSPLPRNRVSVRIDIREGEPASVREIQFVGNRAFKDDALADELEMGPRAWWAIFSSSDKYSRQRLAADLETLRSFYQDRGFINFTITSTQVSISPDRRRIHITVNLDEGDQYRVGEVSLAGDLIFEREVMRGLLELESGQLYSQQGVTDSTAALREKLGQAGYAFANINAVPETNDESKTVDLTFYVDPAERMYVRRLNITGNERTRDDVVRREMLQAEGGWLSTAKVRKSKQRLGRLGFFDSVDIETPRVPGTSDQVDVNVDVKERLSGSLQAGIGFSDQNGIVLNFSVQQDNFLGSGDKIAFTANNDNVNTVYRVSYLDRFYTREGIDRNLALAYRDTDAEEADLSDYGVQSLTGTYGYRIPLDNEDSLGFDLEYEDLELKLRDNPTALQQDFVDENGERNRVLRLATSWIRDTRDRAIFARSGSRQQLKAEVTVPGSDLHYYRADVSNTTYLPLGDAVTFSVEGSVSYGDGFGSDDRLPFFENYYAGGISTVRGYDGNSLGPRDENDDPTGGNARFLGSAALRFPPPWTDIDADATGGLRLATFVDVGQVWSTYDQDVLPSDLRAAAGLALIWYSPLGPLTMSVAEPLNDEPNDERQFFQFSLGSSF